MGENLRVIPKGYKENQDLLPMPQGERTFGTRTFSFMMFGLSANLPLFFLGPIAKSLGLDIWQTIIGAFLGNLIVVIAAWLIGVAGVKYGITYPVQLRSAFGFKGIRIPVLLRGVSGAVWFGIEIYAASLAFMMILLMAFRIPSENLLMMSIRFVSIACAIYVASVIVIMRRGLGAIGKIVDILGPLLLLYFGWLVIFLLSKPEFKPNIAEMYLRTGAFFSSGFLIYLAAQTNWWATICLNISDLSRGIKQNEPKALPIGMLLGVAGGQTLGSALGYAAVSLTGVVLPQEIILTYAPGTVAILLGLMFAVIAPWTTDVTANAPALVNLFMTEIKASWKNAVTIAGIIAFFLAPWWAVEKGQDFVDYITVWASNYGILLGPIAGIMIADFWIVKKGNYDLQKLYTYGEGGYWYSNGWNKAAYYSLLLTWVLCYIIALPTGQIAYVGKIPYPGGVIWYPAVLIAFLLYTYFSKASEKKDFAQAKT
jgi:NCS1 family nucleobase:cation symporter-1